MIQMKLNECRDRSPADGALELDRVGQLAVTLRQRLYPSIWKGVRDHHAAEDILQDVLLVLIERGHTLRRPECFWRWVYRIAWSKVQDHRRSRARVDLYLDPGPDVTAGNPLDDVERDERIGQLAAALSCLSHHRRTVLYLRFYEQMPCAQIALLMHWTEAQVRVQMHRAKQQLRRHLLAS